MPRNVTLALDDDLLRRARKIAIDRGSTVNALLRDHLRAQLGADSAIPETSPTRSEAMATLDWLLDERPFELPVAGISWKREDLYSR